MDIEDIKKQVKKGRKLHAVRFIKTCPTCKGMGYLDSTLEDATNAVHTGVVIWEDEYQKMQNHTKNTNSSTMLRTQDRCWCHCQAKDNLTYINHNHENSCIHCISQDNREEE